jgi:glycosyltransferase involved in cell wall biosynthesis
MTNISFSIIVPVYNRPDEVGELLESLSHQTDSDFEIVIVEDGSTLKCDDICKKFDNLLEIKYFFKPNSGQSEARNYGVERASGNYLVFFDSDCVIPTQYIATVRKHLLETPVDCFGGPDAADSSFSVLQKAINYAMTSFFTTGGIRGGMKNAEKFSPRSFNMGMSKSAFQSAGGFRNTISEDIEFIYRVKRAGFTTLLFRDAFVFHKRRVSFKKFFKQVNTFGKGRVALNKTHKGMLKPFHFMPSCFVLGHFLLFLLALIFHNLWFLLPIPIFIVLIFVDSLFKNKSVPIALISIIAAYIQLFGYGCGMLDEIMTHRAGKYTQKKLYGAGKV